MAVLCPESQAALWKSMPELNDVIVYPDKASSRQIAKLLADHEYQFESSICWEASEAATAFHRIKVLQRLGYPAKKLEKCLTDPVNVVIEPGPVEHRVRHYLLLVEKLGGNPFVKESFLTPPLEPPPTKPLIALAPASQFGVTHQWPIERYKDLVDAMENQYGGSGSIDWVILDSGTSKNVAPENAELENLLEGRAKNYSEEWDTEKVLSSLPYCSALVSCDNETAHLAAHVGLPAVVIFGPNEPEWKRPLGKQSRAVREHVACSPCYLPKCPLDMRCQNEVTVEMVLDQLQAALAERLAQ
ncbi:lipopolysaccharide heptosyltransferase II [Oceaniferula spumae]|uniref:Lipopolysaccharide heptosyltransferase II n=1 Tax=Oceaniferula spumae TaxID=2979115 RepID=A0AAT9FSJ0_9BACT